MAFPVPGSSIRFGRFAVLPAQRRVLVDGDPVHLGARAFDLLLVLVEHQGEVLAKRDLVRQVWRGVVVTENNLQVQVCALRKVLGPAAVVTVAGRGYAFDASIAVHRFESGVSATTDDAESMRAAGEPLRGRADDCAALARLLGNSAMVTVTGPGGIGKSRVVREVLATMHVSVARIELASLPLEESVASSVAKALDLGFGSPPSARQVARAAVDQHGTVVLENGEQRAEQAAELADALTESTGLRVVCTAQVLLRSRGEHVLRLAPLPVDGTDGADPLESGPAVALLFDAVSALHARARFSATEMQEAAAICRHLDGNPLAIQLAAARVELLGLAGVRRRLGQRFQLLKDSTRTTLASTRHHSLLATMTWSWRLLTTVERHALAALAHFPGRFTFGMARRALGAGSADEWKAIQVVESLVNKSAVLADPKGHSAFRIPETTRLYAKRWAALAARSP